MKNPRRNRIPLALPLVGLLAFSLSIVGCAAEEEEPVVVERPTGPPPPPPPPPVRSVEELMEELRIDDRIMMAEDRAPATTEERRAVLEFFDAFARGDHRAIGATLSSIDRQELERMVERGQWEGLADRIDMIEIQTGSSPDGPAALALFDVDGDFQVQLWYFRVVGDSAEFIAAPTPPGMVNRLSGDWIQAWHDILREEMELAEKPDESVDLPQQDIEEDGGSAPDHFGPSPSPFGPPGGPPSAPPGRRPPGAPPMAP